MDQTEDEQKCVSLPTLNIKSVAAGTNLLLRPGPAEHLDLMDEELSYEATELVPDDLVGTYSNEVIDEDVNPYRSRNKEVIYDCAAGIVSIHLKETVTGI